MKALIIWDVMFELYNYGLKKMSGAILRTIIKYLKAHFIEILLSNDSSYPCYMVE